MNIMLVDADNENIKNFRTYIRNTFPDIRITGAFTDANKDIIPVIDEWDPELILADIKFFGGARYIKFKEIHERFPEIRFIVYGTYNESDYMKRAKEFGVIDFMYRPVKPADLSRCLTQAAGFIKKMDDAKQQKQVLAQNYQERLFQYEEIFLRGLVCGQVTKENEIQNAFSYFNIPLGKPVSVIILRIDHYKKIALTLMEMDKHLLVFNILNIVREQLKDYNAQAFMMAFHEVAVILSGTDTIEEKILLCDAIKNAVYEKTDMRVTMGIGRSYENLREIAVSYREADATFRYRYRMGYNAVIPIEFVEPDNHITYRYPAEREDRLVYAAVVGDYDYCRQIVAELFEALAQSGVLPEHLLSKIIMNIVIRIGRHINEQNLPIAQHVTRFFPTAEVLTLTHLDAAYAFMDNALKNFCHFIGQYHEHNANQLHEAAQAYVKAHYAESFSAAKIALRLNTTPERLNKVFMERERIMLFDYVMWVRVYEAQQLLKNTEQEEEAIASHVGFDDVKYFRSVFKKYEGENPAEFRARVKG